MRRTRGAVPVDTLNDYPKFGIWTDCLYMSANGFPNGRATFNGVGFGALSRADMYAGARAPGRSAFSNGTTRRVHA